MNHGARKVNGISLHYLDHPGSGDTIVLLHGLSANAHSFDELAARLAGQFRIVAPDLRGRGLSDRPASGYSIEEHAKDVVQLLDAIDLRHVILGGHSYGAFLAAYIASYLAPYVRRLILLDIADSSARSLRVGALLSPFLSRLGRTWPSRNEFLTETKAAPFLRGRWDPAMESYFDADIEEDGAGHIRCRMPPAAIGEVFLDGARLDWREILRNVRQPSLLLHGIEPYGDDTATPVVLPEEAFDTASAMLNCKCRPVPGNHFTMLYGEGATRMAASISEFLAEGN